MSQLLRDTFARNRAAGRATFVTYISSGFPTLDDTVPLMLALERGGADVIELGIPFSDPLADGSTIQKSNETALANGVNLIKVLEYVRQARAAGLKVPIVLMGYYNPLLQYGEERVIQDAKEAGANGFIIVDLPPEESHTFLSACHTHQMSFIPMLTPTSTDARMKILAEIADTFLYCVSVTGITGSRTALPEDLPDFIARIRTITQLPLAVGFGISTREHFTHVEKLADGVVIGSAVIKAIDASPENPTQGVEEFTRQVSGR